MKAIKLNSIFPNLDPYEYKIHFARKANGSEPLDVFIEDINEMNLHPLFQYIDFPDEFSNIKVISLAVSTFLLFSSLLPNLYPFVMSPNGGYYESTNPSVVIQILYNSDYQILATFSNK